MQKKLIALALASAFAAPAFAATANVDIYGAVRASVDSVDSDSTDRRTRVSSNNSRIGFKGSEDLGGGLSAIWQWEYAFQLDQQGSTSPQGNSPTQGGNSHRNTFVGLSSKSLGSLTLGTQESPLKTSTGPLAVFGDTLGDYRSVFTKLSTRSDNSVLYTSPDLSGLTMRVMYGARNEAGAAAADSSRMYALSGVYKNGPLYATLAYENNRDVASTTSATTYATTCTIAGTDIDTDPNDGTVNVDPHTHGATCATTATTTSTTTYAKKNNAWRAGVGYTFGATKLGLAYEKNDAENAAGVTTNDGHAWYASVAHKLGNITLAGGYADRSETTSGADNGAKQWTVGATYGMSKRTQLYALYTKLSNDSNGSTGIGGATGIATVTTNTGGDASGISIGVNHSF